MGGISVPLLLQVRPAGPSGERSPRNRTIRLRDRNAVGMSRVAESFSAGLEREQGGAGTGERRDPRAGDSVFGKWFNRSASGPRVAGG